MMTPPTNQTFHFSRWRLLVAKHWAEHYRRYLLSILAIGGLIAAWEAFLIAVIPYSPVEPFMQFATFIIGLFLTGCLFASTIFIDLGSKKKALPWLSLPASHFEKLLCALFFGVVLFYIAYIVIFYAVDIPMVAWSNRILRHHPRDWPGTNQPIPQALVYNIVSAAGAPMPEKEWHLFTTAYFTIQSAFILGSVYFTRFAFIKTVVAVLLLSLAMVAFQRVAVNTLLPPDWSNNFFRWSQNMSDGNDLDMPLKEVRLAYPFELAAMWIIQYGLTPFFWLVTWFRLKEKEV